MFGIVCVLALVFALVFSVFAIIHYVKNCANGEFTIKGELIKLIKFEIHASGSKKGSKM